MANVFISYARDDRARILPLVSAMEAAGLSVWWDPALIPGRRFREMIAHELTTADAVLVIWTRQALQSDWVQDEAEEARQRGVLIPVMLEPVTPPAGFRQLQAADLSQWTGSAEHPEFKALVHAAKSLVQWAARAASPAAPASSPAPPSETVDLVASAEPVAQAIARPPGSVIAPEDKPRASAPAALQPELAVEAAKAEPAERPKPPSRIFAVFRALLHRLARPRTEWWLAGALALSEIIGVSRIVGYPAAFIFAPMSLIAFPATRTSRALIARRFPRRITVSALVGLVLGGLYALLAIFGGVAAFGVVGLVDLAFAALFLPLLGLVLFGGAPLLFIRSEARPGATPASGAPAATGD